jgi:hypothetical protein
VNELKNLHRTYKREYARLVEAVSHAVDRADQAATSTSEEPAIVGSQRTRCRLALSSVTELYGSYHPVAEIVPNSQPNLISPDKPP